MRKETGRQPLALEDIDMLGRRNLVLWTIFITGIACGCGADENQKRSATRSAATSSEEGPTFSADATASTDGDLKGRSILYSRKVASKAKTKADSGLAALAKRKDWYKGWDTLVQNDGVEYGSLPWGKQPKTIKAKVMKNKKAVKLTDYWLRPTGWTTMFGHTLENFEDPNYRTDGVRWDTPTQWVPKMANGASSGGNLTLMTQFAPKIPGYWQGASPLAPQTDWIFHVNYQNGAIMEIFDRQHIKYNANGTVTPDFSEVVATGYDKGLFWSLPRKLKIGAAHNYGGPADFVSNLGERFYGYSRVYITNRFETFTVPPARNMGRDCPAATFEDVIAVRHEQWWWDAKTKTSRGDALVIYMARGIGWIYQLLNDSMYADANNKLSKGGSYFLHMSPVGYIKQSGKWVRRCPHEFRNILKRAP